MKKLYNNQKLLQKNIINLEVNPLIFNSIIKHKFIFIFIRYKAYLIFKNSLKINPISALLNICLIVLNKKRFNKFSFYSRSILNKKIQNGEIYGFFKYSW